jgi:putative DNA primase/helicase
MNPWQERSRELADWAMRLVNRTDAWGAYWRDDAGQVKTYTGKPSATQHPVDTVRLARHFSATEARDVIGLHTLGIDSRGRWAAVDLDIHDADPNAPTPDQTRAYALHIYQRVFDMGRGARPLLTTSNGKGGYHLRVHFREAVAGELLFRYARWMVADHNEWGFTKRPETFPKQPLISDGGYGNWLRLIGRHPKRDYYPDGFDGRTWLRGGELIDHMLRLPFVGIERIPAAAIEPAPESRPKAGPLAHGRQADAQPWVEFDHVACWSDLLAGRGWTPCGQAGHIEYWTRPGKESGTPSASLGFKVVDGVRLFWNWSTSTALDPNRYYTPSQFVTFWDHARDFKAFNRLLRSRGYGRIQQEVT